MTVQGFDFIWKLILPATLHAQSSSECWKFKKVGFSESLSLNAQASECFNYGMNQTLAWFTPSAFDVIGALGGLVAAASTTELVLDSRPALRNRLPATLSSGVRVVGASTLGIAGALFVGSLAVNMHACFNNQAIRSQRSGCGGSAAGNSPPIASMGEAIGFSNNDLRGKVSQFWGLTNMN